MDEQAMYASSLEELLKQVEQNTDAKAVYDQVLLRRIDAQKMYNDSIKKPLTAEKIGISFAYAGFLEGVEFALRNIERTEKDEQETQEHTERS